MSSNPCMAHMACMFKPSMAHTIFTKGIPTCILDLLKIVLVFLTMITKKEMLLHHSPLPITTGRKHRAEAALLIFFFQSVLYTHRKSPLEKDYLHLAEPKKWKSNMRKAAQSDVMLHSLEILSFYCIPLQGIGQSCSTSEDERRKKG